MRRLRFLAWMMVAALAGCAGTPVRVTPPPVTPPVARTSVRAHLLYHVLVGDMAGQQGRLGVAAAAFGKAAQESGDKNLARRSALLALYAHHYREGERLARLWRQADPQSASALEALGDAEVGQGLVARAEQHFEQALARVTSEAGGGGRAFAFEQIAALLWRQAPDRSVLTVMQVVTGKYPRDPVGRYVLADLARRRGHLGLAGRAVDQALVLKPHWEDAAVLKARILWTHDPRLSLAFSKQFLAANADATRLRLDYARRLVSLQYWRKALAQFEVIAEATPNDPQVLYATSLVALKTGDLLLAHADLKRVITLAPGNAHARLYLGEIAERAHRYRAAARWYRGVGAPYQFAAQVRLALLPFYQHRPQASLAQLARLTAGDDDQVITLALARDRVLGRLHRYADAIAVLNQALARVQHTGALLYARALDEERLHHVSAAIADLRGLLVRRPDNPMVLNALGYTLVSHKRHRQQGLALVRKALSLDPGNPYILDSVGWAYFMLGQPSLALPYLHHAYQLSHDGTVAAHLGRALWAVGDHDAARALWHQAARAHPHNVHLQRALARHVS
ncbi:MAG: tetratricopeptide repeat protein [Gammaproteobacteria bacterium]|nr:tetratricopeptide repeat protein [Gammaproteobacteria bacterium]